MVERAKRVHCQLHPSHIAVRQAQAAAAVLRQELQIGACGRKLSIPILRKRRPSRQYRKQYIFTEISILEVDTVDRAEGKAAPVLVSRRPRAALRTSGAANLQTKVISKLVRQLSLPLKNRLKGDEPLTLGERLQLKNLNTDTTARVCEEKVLACGEYA